MRLSVKKAAYADLSRAAYRKSGVVLGSDECKGPVPKGRLRMPQDEILGALNNSPESGENPGLACLADGSTLGLRGTEAQDSVLGYSQPSLRDWCRWECAPRTASWTASWATFSRPFGTEFCRCSSHAASKALISGVGYGQTESAGRFRKSMVGHPSISDWVLLRARFRSCR